MQKKFPMFSVLNIKNKIEKVETSFADDDTKIQEIKQVIDLSVEQDNFTVDKILSLVTFVQNKISQINYNTDLTNVNNAITALLKFESQGLQGDLLQS